MKVSFKKDFTGKSTDNNDLLERLQALAEDRLNERNGAISNSLYSADVTPESKKRQFDRNEEMNTLRDSSSEFD
ncbi:MAG: hypothetical protein FWC47_07755 [Oscillospiraceae bacterium]|nr:hypothetical protein [Oscillospiraceae bacterium]